MFDIITIGDSTLDTFLILDEATLNCNLKAHQCMLCLNYADKIPIRDTAQSVGGNAANIAVGGRLLGLKTALVTEIGDDLNGHAILNELKHAKIDTKMIKMLKGKETRYSAVLNFKSERTILSYHAKRNYSFPKLPNTKWVYYTSLGPSFEKIQTKLITFLKKNPDVKLAVNPGSYQMKNLKVIKQILPFTTLLCVNKEEAKRLFGNKDIKVLLKSALKSGSKMVIITDGTNGSYSFDGSEQYHLESFPIKAKAKTGAGDAYSSGVISALILEKKLHEAMLWGNTNAGGVIQEFGAQRGLLTKTKLNKLLKKHKNITVKKI